MDSENLQVLTERYRILGDAVCARLQQEIDNLGLPPACVPEPPLYANAMFTTVVDPFSQEQDLTGYWYNAKRMKTGSLQFHAGGTFFAEYDVLQPHPLKPQWFVESINAWGSADAIKAEAKLLAAVQE